MWGQLSRFSIVGVLNTGVDLAVLNAATLLTGVKVGTGYALQKGLSFFAAAIFSYVLNKRWTFGDLSQTDQTKKFAQFFTISVVGALINVSTATATVTYGKPFVHSLLAMPDQVWVNVGALCGTAAGFLLNFFGYKLIVFRS
jgi:putative flippase GtrA